MSSVVERRGKLAPSPTDSLTLKTGSGIRRGHLTNSSAARATGHFTREPLGAFIAPVRRAWQAGLDERCDVVIGRPLT